MLLESQIWFYKPNKGILEGESVGENSKTKQLEKRARNEGGPSKQGFVVNAGASVRGSSSTRGTRTSVFVPRGIPWLPHSCCDQSSRLESSGSQAGNH